MQTKHIIRSPLPPIVQPDYRQYDKFLLNNSVELEVLRTNQADHARSVAKKQRNKQAVICHITGLPITKPYYNCPIKGKRTHILDTFYYDMVGMIENNSDRLPTNCYRFITKGTFKHRIISPFLLSAKFDFHKYLNPANTSEFFKGLVFKALDKYPYRQFFIPIYQTRSTYCIRTADDDQMLITTRSDHISLDYSQLIHVVQNKNHPRREFFKTSLIRVPASVTLHYSSMDEEALNQAVWHALDNTLAVTVAPNCANVDGMAMLKSYAPGYYRYYKQRWFVDQL